MAADTRHPLALRINAGALAEIDARAKAAGLSRTEYMVRAALGQITNPLDADSRLEQLEERVERIEAATF